MNFIYECLANGTVPFLLAQKSEQSLIYDFVRRMGQDAGGTASVVEILLRVTMLLFLAIIVAISLRRASASLRHLVWTLSVLGTLLIPVFYWAFPAWRWAVLPAPLACYWLGRSELESSHNNDQ